MKVIFIIILAFCFATFCLKAQDSTNIVYDYSDFGDSNRFVPRNYFLMNVFVNASSKAVRVGDHTLNGDGRGFSFGVSLVRQISKCFAVEAGMEIFGTSVSAGPVYFNSPVNPNSGFTYYYSNTADYFNVPFLFHFSTGEKLKIGASGGAAVKINYYDKIDHYPIPENGPTGENIQGRQNPNLEMRFGIFAELKARMARYRIAPVYRQDLLRCYKGLSGRKSRVLGIGLELLI
jgi:hypothetical protein